MQARQIGESIIGQLLDQEYLDQIVFDYSSSNSLKEATHQLVEGASNG